MVSPNNSKSRTQYREMIAKNLKLLMKENIDIIHIGSTPELLPSRTVLQDGFRNKGIFSKIPFEDNSFWKSNRITNYYLDTLDIFCPEKVCRNNSSEGWMFQDGDHLSELGANKLIPKLSPVIKEILDDDR
jgi:hypothetical protein